LGLDTKRCPIGIDEILKDRCVAVPAAEGDQINEGAHDVEDVKVEHLEFGWIVPVEFAIDRDFRIPYLNLKICGQTGSVAKPKGVKIMNLQAAAWKDHAKESDFWHSSDPNRTRRGGASWRPNKGISMQ
jgi:hypothetical protein